MKKKLLYSALFFFYFSLPFYVYGQQNNSQAVILLYHHISNDTPASTSTSEADFRAHLQYLRQNNFQILPLELVIASLDSAQLPEKTAVISFDDGYRSIYETAFPILKEYDWPFTVFISTKQVVLNSSTFMNWQEINELAQNGATIANHTQNHPHLVERLLNETEFEWSQRITEEITGAEAEILMNTGQSHQILAYPYGEYDLPLQAVLTDLGYMGIAQHSGPVNGFSNITALPRFSFSGVYASMNTFPNKVNSLAMDVSGLKPVSPITQLTMPTVTFNLPDSGTYVNQLSCFNNNQNINVDVQDLDESDSSQQISVSTHVDNNNRRFRFNCTAPSDSGRYYWYSIPWLNNKIPE